MGWIQIFDIILLVILLPNFKPFVLDPICSSCLSIDSSLISTQYKSQYGKNLTVFNLPGFSLSTIVVDLRHLKQFPQQNNSTIFQLIFEISDSSQGNKKTELINDTIIGTNVYELQTTAEKKLMIFFFIQQSYKQFEYMLRDSVSLKLSYSNNRIPNEDSSYLFIVTSQDNINLPVNKPDLANMNSYYLENQSNVSNLMTSETYSESTMYWSTETQFAVPYFPYFSNCQGEGDMMHIMDMLQNETDCNLVPINETEWISEFSFGTSAKADRCLIKRKCTISGQVQKTQYPDWQTLPSQLSLFSITRNRVRWRQFSWDSAFEEQQLVKCKINSSMGSNTSSSYPLKVKLSMGYYQVSLEQKRIISCLIQYDLYVPSTSNFTYQLEISSYPLNHTYIMLNFGFKWYVYMIVFVIIGIIGNIQNLLIWVYHYFVAEERKQIKIMMYFRIIKEILKGTTMALILQIVIIIIVSALMNGKIFQTYFYDTSSTSGSASPRVLFDHILQNPTKNYDSDEMQNLRSGRMGVSFIVIGVTIIFLNCKYFIGKQRRKDEQRDFQILGRILKPLEWNRGKFLLSTFVYILLMYFFIYFAYSKLYSTNIWTFIVVMKVLQVIMQEITKGIFDDILPGLPLKIITDITSYLNTISAADLYDFLFGSLIDVAITMIEKLYIFQIENMIVDKIAQKSEQFNRFYVNLMNEQDGDQQNGDNGMDSEQQDLMLAGQDADNQHVFIFRQAQQVEFFQEQIKEVHVMTRIEQETRLISECKQTQQERKMKRRYFQTLSREYRLQRQLLFKDHTLGLQTVGGKAAQALHSNDQHLKGPDQQHEANQEQKQEAMQRQSAIFQILLDHMAMIYTFLVNPFVVFILWLIYDESKILAKYGIVYNTVVLYILSALVIGVFSVINIIMIFHILQSYIGLSFEEQIADILNRFNQRETFWKADEVNLNDKLKPQILGADHYCLSSQLFFILTVYVGGMILIILGMAIIFQTNHNFFSDIATIPVALFWIFFLFLFIFVVKKVAIFLNVWDYKKYVQAEGDQRKGNNLYGIMDQKDILKMIEQNSDFKTQNIIFAPVEQLPKFKKIFNVTFKKKESEQILENDQQQKQVQDEKEQFSIERLQQERKKPIHEFQRQIPQMKISNNNEKQQIILAQKRIETICKKLQPLFSKQSFKLQYSKKNSRFIKENLQRILPLVDHLPELQQFKNILAPIQGSQTQLGQTVQLRPAEAKRQETGANKNMDPIVAEMILQWLRVTEKQRSKRINNGLQEQSKLKKCSFCFETWGLYYGNNGTCLKCSMKINDLNREKQEKKSQRLDQLKSSKTSLISSTESNLRKGKRKKSTKKKNKLNIITQEEDFDQQNESDYEEDQNSQDEIIKTDRKEHHD